MTSYDVVCHFKTFSLGEKIGVKDLLRKRVKKGNFLIYDFRNGILIKFWFRNIYFGIFLAFVPTKQNTRENKILKRIDLKFGPLKIKKIEISNSHQIRYEKSLATS